MKRVTPTDFYNRRQIDQAFDHLVRAASCLDRIGDLGRALSDMESTAPGRVTVLRAFVSMLDSEAGQSL